MVRQPDNLLQWQPWPDAALSMARTALSLTSQDWSLTGSSSDNGSHNDNYNSSKVLDEIIDRMVSLLLIRIVALVSHRLGNFALEFVVNSAAAANVTEDSSDWDGKVDIGSYNNFLSHQGNLSSADNSQMRMKKRGKRRKMYEDYSTSTICKCALRTSSSSAAQKSNTTTTEEEQIIKMMNDDHNNKQRHVHVYDDHDDDGHYNSILPSVESGVPHESLPNYDDDEDDINNHGHNNKNLATSSTTTTTTTGLFPKCITPQIIQQLRSYVHTICTQYHTPNEVPYHNLEHAYHVFLSANKLLDLMLCVTDYEEDEKEEKKLLLSCEKEDDSYDHRHYLSKMMEEDTNNKTQQQKQPQFTFQQQSPTINYRPTFRRSTLDDSDNNHHPQQQQQQYQKRPTYGIKSDPLTQLAFLFSALVHDVDHTGISNRQLVLESDDLAILYNDQSVAEQRSLAVAFSTLKRSEYDELRQVLFFEPAMICVDNDGGGKGATSSGSVVEGVTTATPTTRGVAGIRSATGRNNEDFFKFRKLVIDLVLVTDIASPERTQIVKSKWKEAFGEVIVAEKMMMKRNSLLFGGTRKSQESNDYGGESGRQVVEMRAEGGKDSNNYNGSDMSGGDFVSPFTRAVSRRFRRATVESSETAGTQGSILTADISLSSNRKTPDLEMKSGRGTDDYVQLKGSEFRPNLFSKDSIDVMSESSSLSDLQSLDDDFDTSVVSRTKMSFDGDGDSGVRVPMNENPSSQQEQQQQQTSNTMAITGHSAHQEHRYRYRKSTGNIAGDSFTTRGRSMESRPTLAARRWSTMTARGRHSQSMLITNQELNVPSANFPRARSAERRLGVRCALDLAGKAIIAYNDRPGSLTPEGSDIDFDLDDDWDEIDELKATVVLEQMIRAADVAALFQDWNTFLKWSTRLFKELKNGFLSNRGEDPAIGWYDNQMKFFDFYIKPLAKNLEVMSVFNDEVGHSFVHNVKSNLARWIEEGERATEIMIKQDEEERAASR